VPLQFLAIGAQPRRWLPTGVPVRREKAVERIDFRSGVNLGDMIADDDDIFAESMYLSQNGLQVLIRDEAAPHIMRLWPSTLRIADDPLGPGLIGGSARAGTPATMFGSRSTSLMAIR
jgi:hypothetical protein